MQDLVIKEELKNDVNGVVVEAKALVVLNNQQNECATVFIKKIKATIKKIGDELDPAISAYELHKHLTMQKKKFLRPLQDAEQILKNRICFFTREQERIRAETERKAREKAEAEERKRKEDLEKQAKNHEDKGRPEKAEERRQQAEETHIPAPIVPSKVQKQEGVSKVVKQWGYQVVNKDLLPKEYLIPDDVAIGKVVRALKDQTRIPGIRIFATDSVRVRA